MYQAASKVAMDTLECNLHAIEKLQKAKEGTSAPPPPEARQADFRA